MLCPKVKTGLLEIIRHVENDNCTGCAPLKPIIIMAKLSPVYRELVAGQGSAKPN